MNNDTHPKPPTKQVSDAAKEVAQQADDSIKKFSATVEDVSKDITNATTDAAKDIYQKVKGKTEETLSCSKDYVRRNPMPVVLGAVAFGATLGCLVMIARRKPTFRERYVEEPLGAVREVILDALSPVTERMHKGYDSARGGAGKVIERVHDFGSGRSCHSISNQIGRMGNNLKFW